MKIEDIKDLNHWQIAIAAAGLAITVAALAAGARPMVIAGLGVLAFGVGQMRNHPLQEQVLFDPLGNIKAKISGHPRSPSALGVALEIIGAILFLGGLGWYVVG